MVVDSSDVGHKINKCMPDQRGVITHRHKVDVLHCGVTILDLLKDGGGTDHFSPHNSSRGGGGELYYFCCSNFRAP